MPVIDQSPEFLNLVFRRLQLEHGETVCSNFALGLQLELTQQHAQMLQKQLQEANDRCSAETDRCAAIQTRCEEAERQVETLKAQIDPARGTRFIRRSPDSRESPHLGVTADLRDGARTVEGVLFGRRESAAERAALDAPGSAAAS